jgi:cytochrome c oxidase cbb3-type subunit 2
MSSLSSILRGWRGICLVAITYVYFLIFAQFAFLQRLAELHIAGDHLKAVMASMALAGILCSLLAAGIISARVSPLTSPRHRLQLAFLICAAAGFLTLLPLTLPTAIVIALLIGSGLGLLTVTLVTHLRTWLSPSNPLLQVSLGTGLGYFTCNFPPLFTASASGQSLTAALLCLAGFAIASTTSDPVSDEAPLDEHKTDTIAFPRVLLSFTALIWLDSAAFFIIQNTPALKSGTWQGTAHLWLNGGIHLLAAIACAFLLRRKGLSAVLVLAFLALAAACLLLLHPNSILLASLFYPAGVSLYSVALVAYPALLFGPVTLAERSRRAGFIYAIAGWIGSALGIGMGQNLGHVPPLFVACAGLFILTPAALALFRNRTREVLATSALLLLAFGLWRLTPKPTPPTSAIARGRAVYISEGCIHCHSQYVRPNTPDVLLWGPTQTLAELRAEHPPLIGNRRQGPDLSEVGSRRSPLWMRAHFFHPSEVSHDSFMPTYAALFAPNSTRGDDLIAYLQSLQGSGVPAHRALEASWHPNALVSTTPNSGPALYNDYCATCHNPAGETRLRWQHDFHRLPPILTTGPFLHLPATDTPTQHTLRLARILKFGIPNTDMPGHEYLSDADIVSLTRWLEDIMPSPTLNSPQGARP